MGTEVDFLHRSLVEARIEELHMQGRPRTRSGQPSNQSWSAIARLLGQVRASR